MVICKDQYRVTFKFQSEIQNNHFSITWNSFIVYELAWNVFIDVK